MLDAGVLGWIYLLGVLAFVALDLEGMFNADEYELSSSAKIFGLITSWIGIAISLAVMAILKQNKKKGKKK